MDINNMRFFLWITLFLLMGESRVFCENATSKVTLITTISPCPSYPRTIFLEISQYSLMRNIPNFEEMPKIIVCDGVKNLSDAQPYEEFKQKLKHLIEKHPHFKNTQLIFCEEWRCLVGAVKEALKSVKTEYVFLHQDDFELIKPIDLEGLISTMDHNHDIKHVRLNSCINNRKSHGYGTLLDEYKQEGSSFPLLRTSWWSDNDHIARLDYYTDFVMPLIGENALFMEHPMNDREDPDYLRDPASHKMYGTFLYGGIDEGPFIFHLDRKSSAW